ncbi:unnamed protein product [Pylaiella littoralis]
MTASSTAAPAARDGAVVRARAEAGEACARNSSPRLKLAVLRHPLFSSAMWSIFLLLSFIMVFHNVVLQSWGIGTFDSITARVQRQGEKGFYSSTPLYDAEGKPSILSYARTPTGRFMHILPAGLWSVIAPLQLSPTFRAKHRIAHRRLGRLFILMSVSISLGLVPIVLSGATSLRKSVFVDGSTITLAAYFLVAGLLAVRHARNRRFSDHRLWMLRHVAMGYSVHMQRLLGYLSWWVLPLVVPGYSDLTQEGAQLRADVFGLYFVMGATITVVSMELWLRHTSPSGKILSENGENATKMA